MLWAFSLFFLSFFFLFPERKLKTADGTPSLSVKNLHLLWYRWILVMLLLWLLAWHLIKRETESIRTVFAQGQLLKWWQMESWDQQSEALVRGCRLGRGTDCTSHNSDQHKQLWSHIINFTSWNSCFSAAHWQLFLLCCDFPTPPPQIVSFFELGRRIICLYSSEKLLACAFLCPFSRQLFKGTQMLNRDAKHKISILHQYTHTYHKILARWQAGTSIAG